MWNSQQGIGSGYMLIVSLLPAACLHLFIGYVSSSAASWAVAFPSNLHILCPGAVYWLLTFVLVPVFLLNRSFSTLLGWDMNPLGQTLHQCVDTWSWLFTSFSFIFWYLLRSSEISDLRLVYLVREMTSPINTLPFLSNFFLLIFIISTSRRYVFA